MSFFLLLHSLSYFATRPKKLFLYKNACLRRLRSTIVGGTMSETEQKSIFLEHKFLYGNEKIYCKLECHFRATPVNKAFVKSKKKM